MTERDRGILPEDVPVGVTLDRQCAACGVGFTWTSVEDRQWPPSYCTKKCRRRAQSRRQKHTRMRLDDASAATETDRLRLLICIRCELPFGWVEPEEPADAERAEPPLYHSISCRDAGKKARKKRQIADEREARTARREARAAQVAEDENAARIAAMSAAARELLLPATHCQTCGKVASPTKDAAKEAKRAIEQRAGRTNEVRYYQCPDGWWHWTRMDATLDGFRARQAELLMTESPASLRHRGRGSWAHLGETR